ncbi:PREDICTED: centromere protein H [Propithecus coquereli]|uniref:centromere protein H n=1 Tax=Propithecus coquereli TaxID=379532 RepID=UPI00063F3FB2|nr:PREDICTED: centromere protein H [Propithecus coquereli]
MDKQPEEEGVPEPADSAGAGEAGEAGGPPQVAGAQEARPEDRMTLLLRLRAQTKQQLLEYKSMVDTNEEKTPEQIMQDKEIEAKIEDLENEIEEVKIAFEMKNLALDRMRLSTVLKKNLEKINIKTRYDIFPQDLNLILGSKVNWAEDSGFKETVLQLEKNLTTL